MKYTYIQYLRMTGRLPDSCDNTAPRLVFHSGLTGLETSWAFCLIAEWISLLPSSACLKLYPRVFSWAKSSLRSWLIACPRCSLLGKFQQQVSIPLMGPLDGAWLTGQSQVRALLVELDYQSMNPELCWLSLTMSQWILSYVGWAWLWFKEYCPTGDHESVAP